MPEINLLTSANYASIVFSDSIAKETLLRHHQMSAEMASPPFCVGFFGFFFLIAVDGGERLLGVEEVRMRLRDKHLLALYFTVVEAKASRGNGQNWTQLIAPNYTAC